MRAERRPTPLALDRHCRRCELSRTCKSVCVAGRHIGLIGPVDIAFVGQAPGAEEDAANECWVGPAGELLADLIAEHGLDQRYSIWLDNSAKCAPPGDARPNKSQLEACFPYLYGELRRLKPRLVVPLGDVALAACAGLEGITRRAGVPVQGRFGWECFPIFHPSFVLHRESALGAVSAMFLALKRRLEGATEGAAEGQTKVRVCRSLDDFDRGVVKAGGAGALTAFDYEATALDPRRGCIRCVSFCWEPGKALVFPVDEEKIGLGAPFKKALGAWAEQGRFPKAAHNAVFETLWTRAHTGKWLAGLHHDPKCLHSLIDENSNAYHPLKDLICEHVPEMAGYDAKMRRWLAGFKDQSEGYATADFEVLAHYCGQDSDAALRLTNALWEKVRRDGKLAALYHDVIMPGVITCAKLGWRGSAVNRFRLAQVSNSFQKQAERIGCRLDAMASVGRYLAARNRGKKRPQTTFNLNSAQQIGGLLFGELRLRPLERTALGTPSTGIEVIKRLPQRPEVKALLEYGEIKGLIGVLDQYAEALDIQGIIHADYDNARIVTGRLVASHPNLMAQPRDERVGSIFQSRFDGGCLVSLDYRQLEMRLLAEETGEPSWVAGFNRDGWDPHHETATRVMGFRDPISVEQRRQAKDVNFGIVYGVGAKELSMRLGVPSKRAKDILAAYWDRYLCIRDWFADRHLFLRRHGWIASRTGRVRHLPDAKELPENEPAQWRAMRQGPNFCIQELAASICQKAINDYEARAEQEEFKSLLVNQVHDKLIIETWPGEVQLAVGIARWAMLKSAPARFGVTKVRLAVDVKVSGPVVRTARRRPEQTLGGAR